MKQFLFSYGTLQLKNVQMETFCRLLIGEKDKLQNYKIQSLEITDKEVLAISAQKTHPIAVKTDNKKDFIKGVIFEISAKELIEIDKYEAIEYHRKLEKFVSGKEAWVYVAR